jgi:hypothetical protein
VACIGAERSKQGYGGEALEKTVWLRNLGRWEDGIKMDLQETE